MKTMHARRQFWARHVQDWQASQLTQAAYCRQHDLKLRALSYWLHRHKQDASPVTLVPLAVQEPYVSRELLLQHANGWQLTLPAGVEASWLAGLLRGMA